MEMAAHLSVSLEIFYGTGLHPDAQNPYHTKEHYGPQNRQADLLLVEI